MVQKKKKSKSGDNTPETTYETVRHCEERDKFIEQFGIERFDKEAQPGGTFEKYVDIPIPEQYQYVWEHFIYMWSQSEIDINGNRIFSFGTVKEYQDLFGYDFSIADKKMFFKMKNWATEIVCELDSN
ncbi:MAG: hypothetical protein MJZ11_08000 [Lachnospiraceae bacterium]|nr:hypothetical protein [Lachnospiraceae bacterium]